MQLGFYFDKSRCVKCLACEAACKDENDVGIGPRWIRVTDTITGTWPNVARTFMVTLCMQCEKPPCIDACPTGAITKNADNGIVLVNKEKCISCKMCLQACPFGVPQFGEDGLMGEEKMVNWEAIVYHGNNLMLIAEVHSCPDCDWPWIGMHLRPEMNMPTFMAYEEKGMDREFYRGKTRAELEAEFSQTFAQIIQIAPLAEASRDMNQIFELSNKLSMINDAMNEKLYERADESTRYPGRS